jgi:hypothetical protein
VDQRDVHTADEADGVGLGGLGGGDTGEVGGLLLGEDQVGDVLGLDGGVVDDAEGGVGNFAAASLTAGA